MEAQVPLLWKARALSPGLSQEEARRSPPSQGWRRRRASCATRAQLCPINYEPERVDGQVFLNKEHTKVRLDDEPEPTDVPLPPVSKVLSWDLCSQI
jgi:hypothetical protein